MPLKLKVSKAQDVVDPLAKFKDKDAAAVLKAFQDGGKLFVWRCSSPHNWYLTSKSGKEMSVEDRDGRSLVHDLLRIAEPCYESPNRIAHHWVHRDGGLPEKSGWSFSQEKLHQAQQRWAEEQAVEKAWAEDIKPLAFNPAALSEMALALFRTLKNQGFVYAVAEINGLLEELRLQGIVRRMGNGRVYATAEATKLRIPRGLSLALC